MCGKTRAMIADACNFACDKLYNSFTQTWEENGTKEPTMFITTEQEIDEIQTMMLAFLSDVDEAHIIYNNYLKIILLVNGKRMELKHPNLVIIFFIIGINLVNLMTVLPTMLVL